MRIASSVVRLAALSLGLVFAANAGASEEAQLLGAINAYRSQAQHCAGQASEEMPPLSADPRLIQPAGMVGDLQEALHRAAYPMVNAQAISLSGPRDAQTAMKMLQESFCQVLLDPQYVDIGVSQAGRDWRIVLARPLLDARLGDWQTEGQKLLERINAARAQSRQCGGQPFAAANPSRRRRRWPGMPRWGLRRKPTAGPWPTATSSPTRTATAAFPATGRSWPVTAAG